MNKSIFNGNLVADPKMGKSKTGTPYALFTVAVNRRGKDAGADFIPVVAWDKTAEFADKWLSKGKPIMVIGELQSRTYQDRNGEKRTVLEVVADQLEFIGPKTAIEDESFDIPDIR